MLEGAASIGRTGTAVSIGWNNEKGLGQSLSELWSLSEYGEMEGVKNSVGRGRVHTEGISIILAGKEGPSRDFAHQVSWNILSAYLAHLVWDCMKGGMETESSQGRIW